MQKRISKIVQPESDIIRRCRNKDERAFKILVEMYLGYAYNLAFRLVTHEEDARDIVQEAFIRVWKHIKNYNSGILFTTWLYKIVINLSYDHLKAKKRKNHIELSKADEKSILVSGNPDTGRMENKDLIRKIRSFSKELTIKQRMVFILRDLQDLSVKEVSQILNISEGAVKTNLYLARLYIREKLAISEKYGGA